MIMITHTYVCSYMNTDKHKYVFKFVVKFLPHVDYPLMFYLSLIQIVNFKTAATATCEIICNCTITDQVKENSIVANLLWVFKQLDSIAKQK